MPLGTRTSRGLLPVLPTIRVSHSVGGLCPGCLCPVFPILAALPALAAQYAWVQQLPVRWMRDLDIYLVGIGALLQESTERLKNGMRARIDGSAGTVSEVR
ncbi:MAG: hypothetical protein LBQ81_10265 [Zoogloeaceae bacterium]|nr:hypothetical protein [Zoogloeaceae bacterium]